MKPKATKQAKKTATKAAKPVATKNAKKTAKAALKKGDNVVFLGWEGDPPEYEEGDTEIVEGMVGKVISASKDAVEVGFDLDGDTSVVELGFDEVRLATKADIAAAAELMEADEEEEDTEEEADEEEATYEELSLKELKAECASRGLAKTGDKEALIERLEENDAAPEEEDEAEEDEAEEDEAEEDEAEEDEEDEESEVEPDHGSKTKGKAKVKAAKPVREKSVGRRADEEDKAAIRELTKRAKAVDLDLEDAENGETWVQFEKTLIKAEKEAARPALKVTKSVTDEIEEDGDNAIAAAKRLVETAERTYYTLGGVLAVIDREKLHETVKVKGEFPYAGDKGFELFCEEHLNVKYRKARYLINIYEAFTQAGLSEGKIGSIGWSKAKELVAILQAEPDKAEEWVDLAKANGIPAVADAVKARLTKIGAKTHGNTKTTRTVTCKFTVHADEGTVVEQAIALAKEQADTESDSEAFAYIIKEWMTFQK